MKFLLALFVAAGILIAQQPSLSKRVFPHGDATITVIAEEEGLLPLLHTAANIEADMAIIEFFYRYETDALKGADGKPVKLLLSVHVNCPVLAGIDSACDYAPARVGFSLQAIEFVRVKFLRTTREIDHIKPQ